MSRHLGPPLTDAEREIVFATARGDVGEPWKHKGRSDRGRDCIGWLRQWFLPVRDIPDTRLDYGRTPHNGKLRAGLIEYLGDPISGPMQPGDVVTMHWTGDAHHVGLIVPHPFRGLGLIHADNTATGGPRVVEHGIDKHWRRRIIEWWRP
jgi:cell wall-associated NlpC family hydrolase